MYEVNAWKKAWSTIQAFTVLHFNFKTKSLFSPWLNCILLVWVRNLKYINVVVVVIIRH